MAGVNLSRDGYAVCAYDADVAAWADTALAAARDVAKTPGDLRHGGTWRVGVDELPNAPDGSVNGVPLKGNWSVHVNAPAQWHHAQLSIVFPGYPRQDPDESDAAHRFRLNRDAAHVDGLLPEGPKKRRHLREPHAFILGLPLNNVRASPLVVWPGSHHIIRAAFAKRLSGKAPEAWGEEDVTDVYQTARKDVFAKCPRVPVVISPGQSVILNRHLVHGVAPWGDHNTQGEARFIAYFRPMLDDPAKWL